MDAVCLISQACCVYLLSMKAMKCCCHCWRRMGKISSALLFSILRSCAILSARGFSSAADIGTASVQTDMVHQWQQVSYARVVEQ